MIITLDRIGYLPDAVVGFLQAGALRLATVTDAWRPNSAGPGGMPARPGQLESCVPDGLYQLEPHDGTKWKDVWALVNHELGVYHWPDQIPKGQTWGRSACLIHAGNNAGNVEGCIAVGKRFGYANNMPWVYDSVLALDALRAVLKPTEKHQLLIRPSLGTVG